MSYSDAIAAAASPADNRLNQYKAFQIDGTIAENNSEAMGLLNNKPNTGHDMSLTYHGRSPFLAGGAVTAGGSLKVTTSGFIIAVTSGDISCGKALFTVASGACGRGVFDFAATKTNPGA